MRILITGISTRAVAQSARAAGFDFVTLDYFGDFDQKSWCENYSLKRDFELAYGPVQLLEASRKLRYDAVVYGASLENHPEIVAKLAGEAQRPKSRRLVGNSPATLARVRDWPDFFAFLARQGVPAPQTLPTGRRPALGTKGRWLRKPARSGGGHNITFWSDDQDVGAAYLLQEYTPGRACSAAFLANGRQAVLLGVTEQLIGRAEFGAAHFAYCGNLFPLLADESVMDQIRMLADCLTREYGLVGLNGLDFLLRDGQICPLEVNPRYSASMELIEAALKVSLFEWHVSAIEGHDLPGTMMAAAPPAVCYGKAILYAERDCRAPDTRDWPAQGIRDVPFPGEEFTTGSPVCTVLADGTTPGLCYANLVARAGVLKGELYA